MRSAGLRAVVLAMGLGVALPARAQTPSPPRRAGFVIALGTEQLTRRLVLDQGETQAVERDSLWKLLGLWAGIRVWYGSFAVARSRWRGDTLLGTEFVPFTMGLTLALEHTLGYVLALGRRWSFVAGLRVQCAVDLPGADYPHGEVGLPLGVGWRGLELTWLPSVSFPLAERARTVLDGEIRRGIDVNFIPVSFRVSLQVW